MSETRPLASAEHRLNVLAMLTTIIGHCISSNIFSEVGGIETLTVSLKA
jgi:hypothetical protein